MKNAGKACNNRLYRHIRTFEKIVKNYFVISFLNYCVKYCVRMFCGEMYDYINTTHNINKCFTRRNGADFEQINNYNKG